MMSRRTDQAESPPIAAAHHVRDCLDGRARRQPGRDHRMWENPCIGIDRSATPRLEPFELADVSGFMNPQEAPSLVASRTRPEGHVLRYPDRSRCRRIAISRSGAGAAVPVRDVRSSADP